MNSITLTGRLVKDVHSGKGYSAFTLAVDKGLSKEKMAEYKEQNKPTADFIPCMAFSKTGELAKKYLRRGSKVLVQGSLSIRNVSEGDVYKSFTNVSKCKIGTRNKPREKKSLKTITTVL